MFVKLLALGERYPVPDAFHLPLDDAGGHGRTGRARSCVYRATDDHGSTALQSQVPVRRGHRVGRDHLVSRQIGRAHLQTDLESSRHELSDHSRGKRRRPPGSDTACEQNTYLREIDAGPTSVVERTKVGTPEIQAPQRPDVAPRLGSFKDEVPETRFESLREYRRRGTVQVANRSHPFDPLGKIDTPRTVSTRTAATDRAVRS